MDRIGSMTRLKQNEEGCRRRQYNFSTPETRMNPRNSSSEEEIIVEIKTPKKRKPRRKK
jgi:hypothetical protein